MESIKKKIWNLVILLLCILIVNLQIGVETYPVYAEPTQKQVHILASHDLHSHLDSFDSMKNDKKETFGGFARMKTFFDMKKAEHPDTFIFDAGDFSMGTLYQVLYETEAIELVMMGKLGFDATTFGNHEFDYGSTGIANMLNAAIERKATLPQLVNCNVDWSKQKGDSGQIKKAYEAYGGKDYTVIQKGDVSIAVLGVFGLDALNCAPTAELTFLDPIQSVKKTVQTIQEQEDVDMIVCLSHSGTEKAPQVSEDELLAKAVPALDIIISGHTHTYLNAPIVHGDTYIVSSGEYGKYVSAFSMLQKENGRWQLESFQNVKLDDSFAEDATIVAELKEYHNLIEENYLQLFGYEKDQVLFRNDYTFESLNDISHKHEEIRLGNYITDAYRYSVERLSDIDEPVDVAVVPSGVIRTTLIPGMVTVDKIFEVFSLGTGADGIVGYPLVSAYLTGAELKTVAEIDATISDFMNSARMHMSGLHYTFNPNRLIFNKVTDIYLTDKNGKRKEIQNNKLYRVVVDYYSAQMLSTVTDLSKGLLTLKPKTVDGKTVKNMQDLILYADGKELKAWYAIAAYTDSFEEENGVKVLPSYYATTQNRKVVNNSKNLWELIKKPNKYAFLIIGVIVVLLAMIVLIVWGFWRFTRKRKKKK